MTKIDLLKIDFTTSRVKNGEVARLQIKNENFIYKLEGDIDVNGVLDLLRYNTIQLCI